MLQGSIPSFPPRQKTRKRITTGVSKRKNGRPSRDPGVNRPNRGEQFIPLSGIRVNADGSITIFGLNMNCKNLKNQVPDENSHRGTIGYSEDFIHVDGQICTVPAKTPTEVSPNPNRSM